MNTNKKDKVDPVKPAEFQLAEHRYRRFDCVVPSVSDIKDLENPDLWVNVAPQMNMFDEVRAIAEDHSFVAYLVVTFSQGTDAMLKVINGIELGVVGDKDAPQGKYDIKLAGVKKFVLYNTETGEFIKENIPTKKQAYIELEDYIAALRR